MIKGLILAVTIILTPKNDTPGLQFNYKTGTYTATNPLKYPIKLRIECYPHNWEAIRVILPANSKEEFDFKSDSEDLTGKLLCYIDDWGKTK